MTAWLLALGVQDLGLFLVKLLAVVGAAAVGGLGLGWGLSLFARFATRQKVPRPAMLATRTLGALAAGLLVWAWVFSPGGVGGMGGSGTGWWPFGQGGGPGTVMEEQTRPSSASAEKQPTPPPPPAPGPKTVQVRMLGGARVQDQRFYVIEGESPRNADELHAAVAARKQQNPSLQEIDIVIYPDSVDKDNPAVTDLMQWARANGYTPKLSFPRNQP